LALAVAAWVFPLHPITLPTIYGLAVAWAIVPASCFWYEYHYMVGPRANNVQFDRYKYGVQLGSAIWAAIAVSLVAYASNDRFKAPKPTPSAKANASNDGGPTQGLVSGKPVTGGDLGAMVGGPIRDASGG
jgi:hypothetical protein